MDNVIRTWLAMTVEYQRVTHDRMGEAIGRCLGFSYANDFMVGSRDVEWLHHLIRVLVGLFWWYGLVANISKSQTMTFQPVALRLGCLWRLRI